MSDNARSGSTDEGDDDGAQPARVTAAQQREADDLLDEALVGPIQSDTDLENVVVQSRTESTKRAFHEGKVAPTVGSEPTT